MSKMREAFEDWKRLSPEDENACQFSFEAGYQAAIAAIREGGPVARFNWNEAKFEWLTPYRYSEHHLTPLYRIPEDLL